MAILPLPTGRSSLESLRAEIVAAERAHAEKITHHREMDLAVRQAQEPCYQREISLGHILGEIERLRPLVTAPCTISLTIRHHLVLPPPDQLLAMGPLEA